MATMGLILFVKEQKRHLVPVSALSLDALITLAGRIETYTNAKIDQVYFVESAEIDSTETPGQDVETVRIYAKLKFLDNDTEEYDYRKIPAPKLSDFESVEDRGYRMDSGVGQILASYFGEASAQDLEFVEGWLDD